VFNRQKTEDTRRAELRKNGNANQSGSSQGKHSYENQFPTFQFP